MNVRGPILPSIALCTPLFIGGLQAASLEPDTLKAWNEYVESAEKRMAQRLVAANGLLWVDEDPHRLAKVRAGEVAVSPASSQIPKGVPSGLIHDWTGAIFIPHTRLKDVLAVMSDYPHYKDFYRPSVIDSKVISTSKSKDRFSMVLMNKSFFLKSAQIGRASCRERV